MQKISFVATSGSSLLLDVKPWALMDHLVINLVSQDEETIPLHLSLRFRDEVVVANDWDGVTWGNEIRGAMSLQKDGTKKIYFIIGQTFSKLLIDGRTALRIRNNRFSLDKIIGATIGGGNSVSNIRVNGNTPPREFLGAPLRLNKSLMLEGWSLGPSIESSEITIGLDGHDLRMPAFVESNISIAETAEPQPVRFHALLPGIIWRTVPPNQDAIVRVFYKGEKSTITARISRNDVVRFIEDLALQGNPQNAIFESLTAVEHIKYGNTWPLLSAAAKAFIADTVNTFKLEKFIEIPCENLSLRKTVPTHTNQSSEVVSITRLSMMRMQDGFGRDVRTIRDRKPAELLREQLTLHFPEGSVDLKKSALLPLAEFFCRINAFDELYNLWASIHVANRQDVQPTDTWSRSLALPFQVRDGNYDGVVRNIQELAGDGTGWINTACVSWSVKTIAHSTDSRLTSEARHLVVQAFMKLVDNQASNYWGRSGCHNLVSTSVDLLTISHLFPPPIAREIRSFVVRCYGLSSVFWEILNATQNRLKEFSPEVAAAEKAFDIIHAYVERTRSVSRAELESALRFFREMKNYDAGRVRLELLGPAGIIEYETTGLLSAFSEGDEISDVLVRHLAFPNAPELPVELAPIVRRAVRDITSFKHISPSHDTVIQAVRSAQEMLNCVKAGDESRVDNDIAKITFILDKLVPSTNFDLSLSILLALYGEIALLGMSEAHPKIALQIQQQLTSLSDSNARNLRESRIFRSIYPRIHRILEKDESPIVSSLFHHLKTFNLPQRRPSAPNERMERIWWGSSGIFDTIVLIYSCRANLNTRIEQLRKSWLPELKKIGVPYLIVVGDGKNEVVGDILEVDAPDTYEGLPLKTLRMFEWVYRHTSFAHAYKIDDDCFLNVEKFFFSLSHRRCNYYGRPLRRQIGAKPRLWHMEKACSERAKLEIDKSLEPALYADGGSGYALSREALEKLHLSSNTPEGWKVIQTSYSEDKLVGDLLSSQKIIPRSDGYLTAVMRTTHSNGRPIMQWENTFLPSRMSGVVMAHMDNADNLTTVSHNFERGALFPRKVWPSNCKAALGTNSKALELVSSESKLSQVVKSSVAVAAVVRNEMFMLPHFLAHYRNLGVTGFLMVDNLSDDGTLEYLEQQPDVAVFSADTPFKLAAQGSEWKIAMMAQLRMGKWTLVADADELLVFRGYEGTSLPDYLADSKFSQCDAFLTSMLDMYPKGSLSDATFLSGSPFDEAGYVDRHALLASSLGCGTFSNRETRTSGLRHRLIPGSRTEMFVSEKVALLKYKPWMRLSVSFHYASGVKLAPESAIFAHFKYNAEFRAKALREIERGQYFNNAEEYKKYVDLLSEGRDVIYDPKFSVPWRECSDVIRVLGETS